MPSPIHPLAWLPAEWQTSLAEQGQPRYRAAQVFRWIHGRGVMSADSMTDLPKPLRATLAGWGLRAPFELARAHESEDGARKLVLRAHDGGLVETVLLPAVTAGRADDADAGATEEDLDGLSPDLEAERAGLAAPDWDGPWEPTWPSELDGLPPREGERTGDGQPPPRERRVRVTQCVSTQLGCALGCAHCASGRAGLLRNLGAEEIVGQVLAGLSALEPNERLRNVLFMGMGEPLHNFEATARTIQLLMQPEGLGLGARRITVSTAGLVPGIDKLGERFAGKIGLAVSLHGGRDRTRNAIAPIGQRYPLHELMAALRRYRLPPRRRITIEYTLVAGHNDSVGEAAALAKLLRGLPVKVNLIPLNPVAGTSLEPPTASVVQDFQRALVDAGHLCFIRRRRGDDVAAACGQLAATLGDEPDTARAGRAALWMGDEAPDERPERVRRGDQKPRRPVRTQTASRTPSRRSDAGGRSSTAAKPAQVRGGRKDRAPSESARRRPERSGPSGTARSRNRKGARRS